MIYTFCSEITMMALDLNLYGVAHFHMLKTKTKKKKKKEKTLKS